MGQRGPQPSSAVTFRGLPVVRIGGFPAVRWPEHPLARGGLVPIHRLVASEALGRLLGRDERVRFVDGDPWNWAPSNLEVLPQGAPLWPYQQAARLHGDFRKRRK